MFKFGTSSLRELRADIAAMYNGASPEAARLRGAHLTSVIKLTPPMMFANIGSGLIVLWAYTPGAPTGLWIWFAVLSGVCGLAMLNWFTRRGRPVLTASPRSVRRATFHAALLAGVWAFMPLVWFSGASFNQQLTIATLVAGMIGAGSFVLSPLPYASLAWAALFSVGALGFSISMGDSSSIGIALLLGLYTLMVVMGSLSTWQKATALLRAQAQSARQEQMLAVLLQDFEQNAGDALWETDSEGQLKHVSSRLREVLRLPPENAPALTLLQHLGRRSPKGARQLRQLMATGLPFRDLQLSVKGEHNTVHLRMNGKPLKAESGESLGWRGVLSDVSEKVQRELLLRKLAHTDSLTDLANRFTLRDTLAQLSARSQPIALLTIDLDRFKAVNDNHGHIAGDAVLLAVAGRLKACAGPNTLVARLGGDEFAVVLSAPTDIDNAPTLAQRVVDALGEPVAMGTRVLRVGASVGLTVREHDEPVSIDELLVQADMAMYAAKEAGRGQWARYSPMLGEISRRRLAIEQGLRTALENGELALHWQPKVDLATWRITGAEALMRWKHPELGRVSPGEFIPIAEQCGLIDALGGWALLEACHAGAGALTGLTVSVNVSSIQIQNPNFLATLREALQASGLAPARLELELTESVFIEDAEHALKVLTAVRELGVHLALDDFGTGFSSLSYLRLFPFDTLKIDQTFVTELLSKENSRAIVRMITELASTLGMRTISEGIETVAQLQAVMEAGCHEVQGHLVSAARPLQEFTRVVDLNLMKDLHTRPAGLRT